MSQQTAPFLEGKYGWNFGESGWNTGMDENILKFSFMFDRNLDSITASLPSAVNGQAHYLTTDNRIYFAVGTTYFSTPAPKWATLVLRTSGDTYQFNGTSLVQIDSPAGIDSRLDALEVTASNLGTAAFEDTSAFATPSELDIVEAQSQAYTDALRSDLVDPVGTGGGEHVFYEGRSIADRFADMPHAQDFGANGDGVADNVTPFTDAAANSKLTFIPKPAVKYMFSAPVGPSNGAWMPDPAQTLDQLTDGGKLSLWRGRKTSHASGSTIWRFSDRAFFGYAASAFAGGTAGGVDQGTSWLSDPADGPLYIADNAGVLFMSGNGDSATPAQNQPIGFAACLRTSDLGGQIAIGYGAAIISDGTNKAWGAITELQREAGGAWTVALEVGGKNKGTNFQATPVTVGTAAVDGVWGLWFNGGGDGAFGGVATQPATAAIGIRAGGHTWNSGVIFGRDALTAGDAIAMSSENTSGIGHGIHWYNASANRTLSIESTASDAESWVLRRSANGLQVFKVGVEIFRVQGPASAVNGLQVFAAAAGGRPQLIAAGTDADIDLQLTPKGSGLVRFGTFAGSGDVAIIGSVSIKDVGGTIRKVAVVA